MKYSLIFAIIILRICPITSESFDTAIFDSSELEFAKDITTLIIESTLKSNCDGNVFVVSSYCEQYLDHALASVSDWIYPLIVVKFRDYKTIPKKEKDSWTKYLSWQRKSCSLVFICDLDPPTPIIWSNESLEYVTEPLASNSRGMDAGYIKFPRFVTSLDQILYFSESESQLRSEASSFPTTCTNERTTNIQLELMKITGITLSIRVQYSLENTPESRMQVCSQCEFCESNHSQHYTHLGDWQRNKTSFGKFLDIFDSYKKQSFNNFHFRVGYFDYFPHFSCPKVRESILNVGLLLTRKCLGIEWEILTKLGETLQFSFNLTNVGYDIENPLMTDGEVQMTNFTRMITSLETGMIDLAVGGITVTSDRMAILDFSQIFQTEPIVFVVQKPNNIFVLGIWLPFQPHVWPIILLLVAIMSYIFQTITNENPPFFYNNCFVKKRPHNKINLSILIDEAIKASKQKPLLVRMFDALELTLKPMLSQPLMSSQICQPRRFKMLLVLWWFSCLIITTLYNSSLISSLVNPVITKQPESLTELINAGYYFKFGSRHAAVQELINSSSSSIYPEFRTDMDKVTQLIHVIQSRLLPPGQTANLIAYIVEQSQVGSDHNLQLSNMIVIPERLLITGYSFALSKSNGHFKRQLDSRLSRLNAGGLISLWASKFKNKGKWALERKFRLRERLSQINLNLKILQGAFIFLILGLTVSSLIFSLEHLNKAYRFRFYSRVQIISIGRMMMSFVSRFYHNQLSDNHDKLRRKHSKDKFRKVVDTVVGNMRLEQNLAYLK